MKSDSDSKMNFLLDSFDILLKKNQALEKKIEDLEDKFKTINSSNYISSSNLISSSNYISSKENILITNGPIIPTVSLHSNDLPSLNSESSTFHTWASIAKAPPSLQPKLAYQKANQTIRSNQRNDLVSKLSTVAKPRKPSSVTTQSVYVAGFEFLKIRDIWNALFNARFQVSRIINIQWIGKTVLDIVVAEDYQLQFVSELTLNKSFRILNFDPSTNSKAQNPAQQETSMRAFAVRCIKNITNPSNSDACVNHFKAMSENYCQRNQELSKIFNEEWIKSKSSLPLTGESTTSTSSTTLPSNITTTISIDTPTITSDPTTIPNPQYCPNIISDHDMEDSSSNTTAASTVEDGSGAH